MPHTVTVTRPGEKPQMFLRDVKSGQFFRFTDESKRFHPIAGAGKATDAIFARTYADRGICINDPHQFWDSVNFVGCRDYPVEILPAGTKLEIVVGAPG